MLVFVKKVRALLRQVNGRYYVYILHRPCRTPFYVGEGIGDRVFHHEGMAANTSLISRKLNTLRGLQSAGAPLGYSIEWMPSATEALGARALTHSAVWPILLGYGLSDQK